MSNTDWLDGTLKSHDKHISQLLSNFNADTALEIREKTKQLILAEIDKAIEDFEDGINTHTVPEGKDLITRSYVKNSIKVLRTNLGIKKGKKDE